MGTICRSYLLEFRSMKDLNEDSSSSGWPHFSGDHKTLSNGQYYSGFTPRSSIDGYQGRNKDALKQKMLEHEAVFKNQVSELHRLYRVQRDMMDEVERKELHNYGVSIEPASSSSFRGSNIPSEATQKWHMAGFPYSSSGFGTTSTSETEIVNSPMSSTKANAAEMGNFPFHNGSTPKHAVAMDSRPSKARKTLFNFHLPAGEDMDATASHSCLRGSIGLAGLNNPVEIVEASTEPSSVDFFQLGSEKEVRKGHQPFKLPFPSHLRGDLHNLDHKGGHWKEDLNHGLEFRERSQGLLNFEPAASQAPGSYSIFGSQIASSCDHTVLSWAKPRNGYAQKHASMEALLNSGGVTSRGLQPSAQSQEIFREKWRLNEVSRLNRYPGMSSLGSEVQHAGLPSTSFNYLRHNRTDDLAFDRTTSDSCHKDLKPTMDIDLNEVLPKSSMHEVVIMENLSTTNEIGWPKDRPSPLPWLQPKTTTHANEVAKCCKSATIRDLNIPYAQSNKLLLSNCETAKEEGVAETRFIKKLRGFPIFERGIAENEPPSPASTSVVADRHSEASKSNNEIKNIIIDINVACETDDRALADEQMMEKKRQESHPRYCFDLNSCVSDSEDPPKNLYETKGGIVRIHPEINLEEVPVSPKNTPTDESLPPLESKKEELLDEVLTDAAEMIFAISSSCPEIHMDHSALSSSEPSLDESLLWFVNVVSSFENELITNSGKESRFGDGSPQQDSPKEVDDFEAMTLQLADTKEVDYMPHCAVSEVGDEAANTLSTRPRRGQARRGRPRRDFQRDILPGLASLSRQEVTEDLQAFEGLMRATGDPWSARLTRKSGTRSRGRRRAVVESVPTPVCHPPPTEAGMEDRSLLWAKAPTRPRRQRYPAGNPPIALTQ